LTLSLISYSGAENLRETAENLLHQYNDLTSQFHGFPSNTSSSLLEPNNPSLAGDFARASERPRVVSSSFLKKSIRSSGPTSPGPKSVRFSDVPNVQTLDDEAAREALFPYRDDPGGAPDQSHLDNQQIHAYHSQVIRDQDEQLDRLGESIGRQRELSIQIGNELDSHVQLLDEVDGHVERHQSRLEQARKGLGKAGDNMQITTIIILIVILILLIAILK
jgi:syntaxin 8